MKRVGEERGNIRGDKPKRERRKKGRGGREKQETE